MSVTRVSTSRDVKGPKCDCCTEAVKRTLATMLDYNLLKSPSFIIIALSSSLLCLGFFPPVLFIKDTAEQAGVPPRTAFWLISIIGLANTVGRIIISTLANIHSIDFIWLTMGGVVLGGVATIVYGHVIADVWHIGYAIVFGLCVGK